MQQPTNETTLQCDGAKGCTHPVTRIHSKGWAYCEKHATTLGGRKLRAAELKKLQAGQTIRYR